MVKQGKHHTSLHSYWGKHNNVFRKHTHTTTNSNNGTMASYVRVWHFYFYFLKFFLYIFFRKMSLLSVSRCSSVLHQFVGVWECDASQLLLLIAWWVTDDKTCWTHWHRTALALLGSSQVALIGQVPRHTPVQSMHGTTITMMVFYCHCHYVHKWHVGNAP